MSQATSAGLILSVAPGDRMKSVKCTKTLSPWSLEH